jgi:hypothetical protein
MAGVRNASATWPRFEKRTSNPVDKMICNTRYRMPFACHTGSRQTWQAFSTENRSDDKCEGCTCAIAAMSTAQELHLVCAAMCCTCRSWSKTFAG